VVLSSGLFRDLVRGLGTGPVPKIAKKNIPQKRKERDSVWWLAA